MSETIDDVTNEKLASWFTKIREKRNQPYTTDDVLAVFVLLSRGNTVADISRATFITTSVVTKWRDALLSGTIQYLYPDIGERAATFDESQVPNIPMIQRRVRPRLAWQQHQRLLESGHNPYEPR